MDKKDNRLDKDSQKRLDKLSDEWEKGGFLAEKLTAADLRLLLGHFTPLQDLVRAIVAGPSITPTDTVYASDQGDGEASIRKDTPAAQGQHGTELRAQLERAQAELQLVHHQLTQTQSELEQSHRTGLALKTDLSDCTQASKQLLQDKKALERQQQASENELAQCRLDLARAGSAPPQLQLLRQDEALAHALGLQALAQDDTQATIQMVAVNAQRDNLERIWSALKDHCEAQQRTASTAERDLLESALTWYNHNWQTRPYQVINPAAGAPYQYEHHQRSRHTASGETIAAVVLPGIADGSGRPLCKAVVTTR